MTSKAAETLAQAIEQDIEAQEAGRYEDIGIRWDDVYSENSQTQGANDPIFSLAIRFWDDWGDAANHEWLYHEPMVKEDWPRVAREIVACLRSGTYPEDETIVQRFMPRPTVGVKVRLKRWFEKLRGGNEV